MTFAFRDFLVTTWQRAGETWEWRARNGNHVAFFLADRDAPIAELIEKGRAALGLPAYLCGALGDDLWATQGDIMRSVWANRETYVASAHAIGKTFIEARVIAAWVHRPRRSRHCNSTRSTPRSRRWWGR